MKNVILFFKNGRHNLVLLFLLISFSVSIDAQICGTTANSNHNSTT